MIGRLDATIWHDVECGHYTADLGLWRELAAAEAGPVLDVGAGTGRVALDLAGAGHDVWALDRDAALLAVLSERAAARGLAVRTVAADAREFGLERSFGVILVPMQTVQLLPSRGEFLAAARRHLAPGGLLAVAISSRLEPFTAGDGPLPHPDIAEVDGWRFESQPVAVRIGPGADRIERVRRTLPPGGGAVDEVDDVISLAHIDVARLEEEGRAAGLAPEPARRIAPTAEHVGSEVVLLRG
jgi:SAM-dependent methyltransferase